MKVANEPFPQNLEADFAHIFAKWPFVLSDFQKWAIYSIHGGHDTLVCAPTGSGKTLPAEFAIDYFTSKGKKVITRKHSTGTVDDEGNQSVMFSGSAYNKGYSKFCGKSSIELFVKI